MERGADLHMVQLMPLPLTVSCFSKIQIGFTFLVPAHPGSPRKQPLNVCVCVRACVCLCVCVYGNPTRRVTAASAPETGMKWKSRRHERNHSQDIEANECFDWQLSTNKLTPDISTAPACATHHKTGKGSPYSITDHKVPVLIPVLGSQPAGDVSHKPGGRLPLLSARSAVTHATLKRAATNFAAWWTQAQWVWTVCLRLLPDSVATAIWTQALLWLSPAR